MQWELSLLKKRYDVYPLSQCLSNFSENLQDNMIYYGHHARP